MIHRDLEDTLGESQSLLAASDGIEGCDGCDPDRLPVPGPRHCGLYREDGDGHTWPDSRFMSPPPVRSALGPTTLAIKADQLMWAFSHSHPLPG